jgi:hypothetical protein
MGVTVDLAVSKKIAHCNAESVLKLLLKDLGLTYIIQDEVLLITSADVADNCLNMQIYEVTDLVRANDSTQHASEAAPIIDLITRTLHPTAWDNVGGSGYINNLSISDSRFLIVEQTQEVQQEVLDLLTSLRTLQQPLQAAASEKPTTPSAQEQKPPDNAGSTPVKRNAEMLLSARPNEKIRQALEKPITLDLKNIPLEKIAKIIESRAGISIGVDEKACIDGGIDPTSPVDIQLSGMKLSEALDGWLSEMKLSWTVRDNMLLITSQDAVSSYLETRIFDVSDLPAYRRADGKTIPDYEQLIIAVTKSIEPETWDEVGGPGSITEYDAGGIQALVVSQTWAVQEKILVLLEGVRKLRQWPLSDEEIKKLPLAPPPKPKPKPEDALPRAFGDPLPGGMGRGMF